jgi:hypothetical protein
MPCTRCRLAVRSCGSCGSVSARLAGCARDGAAAAPPPRAAPSERALRWRMAAACFLPRATSSISISSLLFSCRWCIAERCLDMSSGLCGTVILGAWRGAGARRRGGGGAGLTAAARVIGREGAGAVGAAGAWRGGAAVARGAAGCCTAGAAGGLAAARLGPAAAGARGTMGAGSATSRCGSGRASCAALVTGLAAAWAASGLLAVLPVRCARTARTCSSSAVLVWDLEAGGGALACASALTSACAKHVAASVSGGRAAAAARGGAQGGAHHQLAVVGRLPVRLLGSP